MTMATKMLLSPSFTFLAAREDLAFEKMLDTFMKRHHLRLWRTFATAPDGREIWLGASTHDIGLDVHFGVVSHAIDPDLDAERAKVGADLIAGGLVAAERLVSRPNPLSEGKTATGGTWKTDGQLLVIVTENLQRHVKNRQRHYGFSILDFRLRRGHIWL